MTRSQCGNGSPGACPSFGPGPSLTQLQVVEYLALPTLLPTLVPTHQPTNILWLTGPLPGNHSILGNFSTNAGPESGPRIRSAASEAFKVGALSFKASKVVFSRYCYCISSLPLSSLTGLSTLSSATAKSFFHSNPALHSSSTTHPLDLVLD